MPPQFVWPVGQQIPLVQLWPEGQHTPLQHGLAQQVPPHGVWLDGQQTPFATCVERQQTEAPLLGSVAQMSPA